MGHYHAVYFRAGFGITFSHTLCDDFRIIWRQITGDSYRYCQWHLGRQLLCSKPRGYVDYELLCPGNSLAFTIYLGRTFYGNCSYVKEMAAGKSSLAAAAR